MNEQSNLFALKDINSIPIHKNKKMYMFMKLLKVVLALLAKCQIVSVSVFH